MSGDRGTYLYVLPVNAAVSHGLDKEISMVCPEIIPELANRSCRIHALLRMETE